MTTYPPLPVNVVCECPLTAGFGPRHMAINSELKKAYVVFELQSYVGVYTMEEDNGFLAENYLVEIMPEPSPSKRSNPIIRISC